MSKLLVVLITIFGFVLVGCGPSPFPTPEPVQLVPEENVSANFRIQHPADWSYVDTPGGSQNDATIAAYMLTPLMPNIGAVIVIRRNTTGLADLNAVEAWAKGLEPPTRQEQQIGRGERKLGTETTLDREYTWQAAATETSAAQLFHCLDNYRLHNGAGYALSFCVDDAEFVRLKPTFEQMITSFEYLN